MKEKEGTDKKKGAPSSKLAAGRPIPSPSVCTKTTRENEFSSKSRIYLPSFWPHGVVVDSSLLVCQSATS